MWTKCRSAYNFIWALISRSKLACWIHFSGHNIWARQKVQNSVSEIKSLYHFFLCGIAFSSDACEYHFVRYLILFSNSFSDIKCDSADEKSEVPAKEWPKNKEKGVELWRLTALAFSCSWIIERSSSQVSGWPCKFFHKSSLTEWTVLSTAPFALGWYDVVSLCSIFII